jgi:chromosome segregation ATPase
LRTREAEETARMVDDLRSLIIEREDQLTELRDQVRRHTEEIDLVTRERDDEREAARELVDHCHELRSQLEAAERERDEVRSTLDQVLSQASIMHEELEEKEIKLAKLEELAQQRESVGEEDVAAARLEAETLRVVVDEHRQSLDELTLRLSKKRRKYAERKSQLAALEGVISEKQDELDAMTRNRNELHQRCEELEAERERLITEREAECAAKEARRSEKAAEHQASIEQMSPNPIQHDQPDQADRRLLRELSEAKKRLRHKRQEVVEFDEALAEMANATRASEEQVAAWESQLLACRQRIAELGSPRSDARHDPAKAERGQRAIAECEADIETLQHYVMAELESMREVARRYGRVRERRDEAARACEELTQQASAIKHEILKTRKRSKARRTSSMTRAHSTGDVLSSEDRADAATARQELESVRWVRLP